MNSKVLAVASLVTILIIASGVYVFVTRNDSAKDLAPTPSATTPTAQTPRDETQDSQDAVKGKYISYDNETFSATTGTRLLFFHAPWCPQCRELDESITRSTIPGGVTVFKVDYDSHQDLRQKYGVTIQTTVVKVDADGNKLDSYVAYDSPSFTSVEANLLQQ